MKFRFSAPRVNIKGIAPYAGIISIGLGFLYWIFNDGVTRRMEDEHRTLSQLGSERWMYEALSTSLRQSGNISKALIRASQNRDPPNDKNEQETPEAQAQREFSYQTDSIAFAQEFQTDLADLVQYAWRVQGLSQRVDISEEQRKRIDQIAHDAEELSNGLSSAAQNYHNKFKEVFKSDNVSVSAITPAQVRDLSPAVIAYRDAAKVGPKYLELENDLNHESASIYAIAKDRAEHASKVAAITTPIGYCVYSLATIIALLGKVSEIKSGRRTEADTAGV